MDIQRLRNLTTGRLHTEMDHIYQDIEYFVKQDGLMTHNLPNACDALLPFLRKRITENRFWDDRYDTSHTGEVEISPLDGTEVKEFWESYFSMPSSFGNNKD